MLKHALTTTAFTALLMSSAFAQSSPSTATPGAAKPMAAPSTMTAPSPSSDTFLRQQNSTDWRASQLMGTNVMGPDNTKIGDVEDVVIERSGMVHAVVIGVGGFLGVGEKGVAIPLKSLAIKQTPNGDKIESLSVSFTKEQLKNAPQFKWNSLAATSPSDKRTEILPQK